MDAKVDGILRANSSLIRAVLADASVQQRTQGEALLASGLVDALSAQVIGDPTPSAIRLTGESNSPSRPQLKSDRRYLRLVIARGLAFLGLAEVSEDATTSLEIHLQYRDKRFSSSPVMSAVEPSFDFQRIFELHSTDVHVLLQTKDRIHVVVTRVHHPSGSTALVGTTELDIRESLCGRPSKKLVEIKECGEDVTVGILEVVMETVPKDAFASNVVSAEEVSFQLKREQRQFDEINRMFYVHAKQWWNDFLQIRTCHAERLVKIFAHDEQGCKLPVTNFIHPIRSRYIKSPRHAARFVSLLGLEKSQGVGSSKTEVWEHPHTILTLSKANLPSLSLLLTSLLLGFNINAYTALGFNVNGESVAWVITISSSGTVELLNPAAGKRYAPGEELPWRSIGCLFNDEGFWANVAVSDSLSGCVFELGNGKFWKALGRDAAMSMKSAQTPFPLLPFTPHTSTTIFNAANKSDSDTMPAIPPFTTLETDLELLLRNQIAIYRDDHDLLTVWDDDLAHLLTQCLSGCEVGKLYPKRVGGGGAAGGMAGVDFGVSSVDFQEGVKRGIPEGHTFKGFPIQFNTLNPQKIFSTFSQTKTCQNLMLTRGDKVRFGVRVKVVGYAEKCVACWVMVAVRYKAYS
ncbi:Centrosomal protein of 76 kDa [Podochytrium sp. JEL0797]|nr:Centrosomal protein of 76 kDa [Podochytrium sp. JEL0797]